MRVLFATAAFGLAACGGGHSASPVEARPALPAAPSASQPPEQGCAPIEWIDEADHETQDPAKAGAFVVPIELDGQTYRFQFDTGADVTILYGTDLARARGWKLEDGGDHPVVRVSGSFAGRRFEHRPIIVYSDMPGGNVAGTIGMDLLVDRVTVVDFPARRVCVHDNMPVEIERRATFSPAVLDRYGRMLVTATLAGRVYERILFDTGSSHFGLIGSFDAWKRWTGLDGEAGVTDRVSGTSWGHEIHMLGAPVNGTLTIGSFSVQKPMTFYCKEKPDYFRDVEVPQDAVMGNAPFLSAAVVLDARRSQPRFGVLATR
jgi:hypothetical protein